MKRYDVTPTTDLSAEELIARGYRRTSNAWCHISRIDRPDWIEFMAAKMHRAPADFYRIEEDGTAKHPDGGWCHYYRAVYSQDERTVSHETIKQIPTSGHDPVGYIEVNK